MAAAGPVGSAGACAGAACDAASPVLHLSMGRAMFPLIPHRSLLRLEAFGNGVPRAGDIVALRGESGIDIRRVLTRDNAERLFAASDYTGRGAWYESASCIGRVAWRWHHGLGRDLSFRGGQGSRAVLVSLCRVQAWCAARVVRHRGLRFLLALLAAANGLLRRLVTQRLYRREERLVPDPETEHVLGAVQAAVRGDSSSGLAPAGLNWEVCLDIALGHRVAALQLDALVGPAPAQAPPSHVVRLLETVTEAGMDAWREAAEAQAAVREALARESVPWLLLKGPALAEVYEGRERERPFTDLDLVVPPRHLDASLSALGSCGYVPEGDATSRFLLRRGHFHLVLDPPAHRRLPIELHWELVDRANLYRIDMPSVFDAARRVRFAGLDLPALGCVDELIYMCIHICKHGVFNKLVARGRFGTDWLSQAWSGNRLVWFVDVHRFLEHYGERIDGAAFWRRAAQWNTADDVRECLALTRALFPCAALGRLLESAPARGSPPAPRRAPPGRANPRLLRWAMRVHPVFTFRPVRFIGLAGLLWPSPARMRTYHGVTTKSGLALAYLVHPWHMMRRIGFGG